MGQPSDTYSGRYEHLSLALSREIDRKLMGKWDSCKRYCLALFNYLKCIPSMQNWYRWIALVLLIIPSLLSCPSVTYSGRYEHFSLALRREIDRRLMGKWDSCKLYLLALFNYLKCILSMQIWYQWIALVVLIIPGLFCAHLTHIQGDMSLALRRDEIDGQMRQLQVLLANPLALFNSFKCIFSVQIWYRWIALVVLVISS